MLYNDGVEMSVYTVHDCVASTNDGLEFYSQALRKPINYMYFYWCDLIKKLNFIKIYVLGPHPIKILLADCLSYLMEEFVSTSGYFDSDLLNGVETICKFSSRAG